MDFYYQIDSVKKIKSTFFRVLVLFYGYCSFIKKCFAQNKQNSKPKSSLLKWIETFTRITDENMQVCCTPGVQAALAACPPLSPVPAFHDNTCFFHLVHTQPSWPLDLSNGRRPHCPTHTTEEKENAFIINKYVAKISVKIQSWLCSSTDGPMLCSEFQLELSLVFLWDIYCHIYKLNHLFSPTNIMVSSATHQNNSKIKSNFVYFKLTIQVQKMVSVSFQDRYVSKRSQSCRVHTQSWNTHFIH